MGFRLRCLGFGAEGVGFRGRLVRLRGFQWFRIQGFRDLLGSQFGGLGFSRIRG